MKFGDYLRKKREGVGLTQPEAASLAEIEQSYLSKLETGKSYPSEDVFVRLVEAYGIDVQSMTASVESSELQKLKEVSAVRSAILITEAQERKFLRGWLLAALIFFSAGGATAMMGTMLEIPQPMEYTYVSYGVIEEGESMDIFSRDLPIERFETDRQHFDSNRGADYIVKVEGGFRHYALDDVAQLGAPMEKAVLMMGGVFMMLLGVGSYFISSRWR